MLKYLQMIMPAKHILGLGYVVDKLKTNKHNNIGPNNPTFKTVYLTIWSHCKDKIIYKYVYLIRAEIIVHV